MDWYHWLAVIYVLETAMIMASYELCFRPRPGRPWIEVIVGTLIWLVPPFCLDLFFDFPKPLFQVALIGSLLVTGGSMMAWIFMVHLNDNQPKPREDREMPAWQQAMLREIEHALDRQAFFVQQMTDGGEELKRLSQSLAAVQAAIDEHMRQAELYRRIGAQVTDDILAGRPSSYRSGHRDNEDEQRQADQGV